MIRELEEQKQAIEQLTLAGKQFEDTQKKQTQNTESLRSAMARQTKEQLKSGKAMQAGVNLASGMLFAGSMLLKNEDDRRAAMMAAIVVQGVYNAGQQAHAIYAARAAAGETAKAAAMTASTMGLNVLIGALAALATFAVVKPITDRLMGGEGFASEISKIQQIEESVQDLHGTMMMENLGKKFYKGQPEQNLKLCRLRLIVLK